MAKDSGFFRRKWAEREQKERKDADREAKKDDGSQEFIDQLANTVRDAALRKVVETLPLRTRKDWPHGNAVWHQLPTGDLVLTVKLGHTNGDWIEEGVSIPRDQIKVAFDVHLMKAHGRVLATRLLDSIKRHESSRNFEQKFDYDPIPEVTLGSMLPKETKKKVKQTFGVGKMGPICLICGPEDRDKYPDWGTCPHGVKK